MRQQVLQNMPAKGASNQASGVLQRKCVSCGDHTVANAKCENCDEEKKGLLQRKSNGQTTEPAKAPPIVHEVLNSPGQALDPETRAFFEPRFGHDFSNVRVHTDAIAAESAHAVNALAYTIGNNIAFHAGQYAPSTQSGRKLLAHELTHVVQQSNGYNRNNSPLVIGTADSAFESEADGIANNLSEKPDSLIVTQSANANLLSRQVPALRPSPPVRPPLRSIPGGRTGPGGRPFPTQEGQRYAPDPYDDSPEAIFERANINDYRERQRLEQGRPVTTLEQGGQPPDFISVSGSKRYDWIGGPGGGGSVTVPNRRFHILDAIEHAVGRANNEEDLQQILEMYIPALIDVARINMPRRAQPLIVGPDTPRTPNDLDPNGERRLEIYMAAVSRRSQAVPALATSRAVPQEINERNRRRGCRIIPLRASLGSNLDPLAPIYCQFATNSNFSYRIESPAGRGEIDALRGNTWFECKCGYQSLLNAIREGRWYASMRLSALDEQFLRHQRIAAACGLEYVVVTSNEEFAQYIRERYFGSLRVWVVPFEPCN